MKKIAFAVIALVLLASLSWAAPTYTASQVTCTGTPTQLYAGGTGSLSGPTFALLIQNIDSTNTVYVCPSATATTSTCGPLTPGQARVIESKPNTAFYCVTAGASVAVYREVIWK